MGAIADTALWGALDQCGVLFSLLLDLNGQFGLLLEAV